jgi:hypothetical protein
MIAPMPVATSWNGPKGLTLVSSREISGSPEERVYTTMLL